MVKDDIFAFQAQACCPTLFERHVLDATIPGNADADADAERAQL